MKKTRVRLLRVGRVRRLRRIRRKWRPWPTVPEINVSGRGYPTPGGGMVGWVEAPPEYRATTVQACGLWPFVAGSGTPVVGTPLGRSLLTGATVCCDPLAWFERAKIVSNPSGFVVGRPGLGKSTTCRRMVLGVAARGVVPLVFGDLKPDYVPLIEALGGNIVTLGRGRGRLNILDASASQAAATRLPAAARAALLADAHGRRLVTLAALLQISRHGFVSDQEESVLSAAIDVLDERHEPGDATLTDLVHVLEEGPDAVRLRTLDRGDDTRYRALVDPLQRSLVALVGGPMGEVFGRHTTTPLDMTQPLCIDVSGIAESDTKLQGAVLLACWGEGFAGVAVEQALTDAGLQPQRHFFIVLDELWRVLRSGKGLVDRMDAITRLNRTVGVGQLMITHTLDDLLAVADDEDRAKAKGFADRAGMLIAAGLPPRELSAVEEVYPLTEAERRMVTDWVTPPAWDPDTGREAAPPGLGKVLIKVGTRPGIPVQVTLTADELTLHDTNQRWRKEIA